MQQKSSSYWTSVQASSAEWNYGVDILQSDESTLMLDASSYLVESSSSVSLDTTQPTHRALKLTLRNSSGIFLPGIAGSPSGGSGSTTASGYVWYNVRYRPWIDLRTGYDSSGNKIFDRTYLGIFVLSQPETDVKVDGTLTALTLLDKSALLTKPFLITNSTLPTFTKNGHTVGGYASGSTFDSVMHDLATRGGIPAAKHLFTPSTLTIPADYSIAEGSQFWDHLQALAGSMAHVIFFDGAGNLVREPTPLLTNSPSVWTFAPGPQSIISEIKRTTDLHETYNHIIVVGGSAQTGTYRGEAQVSDPSNPYHQNYIGDRIVYVGKDGKLDDQTPDPSIGSIAQADARAQMILAQHVGQQESVTITSRNIPALEPFDRVTVNVSLAGLNLDFMAQKITWNLAHNGMTIDATRWYSGN